MNLTEHGQSILPTISALPASISPSPSVIFTDVDDTLTCNGRLPAETFDALYRLIQAGFEVIPVTGASAGWCDCLIKTWPIQHIIGENGALVMKKNKQGIVSTDFVKSERLVESDLAKLLIIAEQLTKQYPDIQLTQDQKFRLTDVAFDIGQTVKIEEDIAEDATQWLRAQGVEARRSSIHINVWSGQHSKSSAAKQWLSQRALTEQDCLFIGDSPNDESMFKQFPLSVGVANIQRFLPVMEYLPMYMTSKDGGYGFVEMANVLLGSE